MAALASLLAMGSADRASAKVKPEEEMRWALYVTMPPRVVRPRRVVDGEPRPAHL
jgi:hypothetical protein